jgi:hypothetical protein
MPDALNRKMILVHSRDMSEKEKALKILREVRRKIRPDVLERAHKAALVQTGQAQMPPQEPENEASRLFKMAMKNGGQRRLEVLSQLERKYRQKLN